MSSNKSAVCGKKIRWIFVWPNLHYEKFADGTVECIEDQLHFELPEGWLWCRLSQIITLHSGQDLEPSRYNDVGIGIPYITGASNLENGKVIINRWTDSPTTHATTGDLLITCKGSGVGKMAWCNICDAHIARQIMALRCLEGLYSDYLEIVISAMLTNIKSKANGLIPGLSRDIILGIMFPLPPFEEQKLICSKCREVLSYIDNIDNQKTDLVDIINVIKSRILDFAIRGKLVPQNPDDEPAAVLLERIRAEKEELIRQGKIKRDKKESIIFKGEDNSYYEKIGEKISCIDDEIQFKIPNSWEWCSITNISELIMGSSPDGLSIQPIGNGVEFHQGKIHFTDKYIGLSDKSTNEPSKIAPANSVLLCVRAPVGEVNLTQRDICIGRGLSAIYPCGSISSDFLFYWLQTYKTYLNLHATGSTFVAITADTVKGIKTPLPPIEEQKRIIQTIESLYSQLNSIEKSLS